MADSNGPEPWYVQLAKFLSGKLSEMRLREGGAEGRVYTMSTDFSYTGYDKGQESRARADALRLACESAVTDPSLAASDIDGDGDLDTKCNLGLQKVASTLGCLRFQGKRANEVHDLCMREPLEFDSLAPERAVEAAKSGGLVVASLPNPGGSGHVAVVYPASGEPSDSLGITVPMVANVGKTNGVMKASKAFPVARYRDICWFLWRRSLD